MGCGMGVIKYLLFIFNFIFVLCGIAILALGIIVQIGNKNYSNEGVKDIAGDLTFPAITLIVIGSIIFVIAFFGCCGAIRESHCMVVTFATLLLTILIIQVAAAIYAFVVLKNSDNIDFNDVYKNSFFMKYDKDAEDKAIVDNIQEGLDCCGITSYKDFRDTLKISVPGSCCGKPANDNCDQGLVQDKRGCAKALEEVFKSACGILGGIALGIAAIELIGIIFALCLANSIKNAERRGYSV